MKSINAVVFGLFASVLTLAGCGKAEAVEIGVGYVNNSVIDKEGTNLKVGSEWNNIRYGVTTMVSTERVETYGAYLGVPLRLQGVQLEITPTITTEYYHEAKETIGGVGLNVGYRINESLVLEGQGTVNRSFDSSNYTGEVYTVGLTKTF
mgnify:FL=1